MDEDEALPTIGDDASDQPPAFGEEPESSTDASVAASVTEAEIEGFELDREELAERYVHNAGTRDINRMDAEYRYKAAMARLDSEMRVAQLQAAVSREDMALKNAQFYARVAAEKELAIRELAYKTWSEELKLQLERRRPGFAVPSMSQFV